MLKIFDKLKNLHISADLGVADTFRASRDGMRMNNASMNDGSKAVWFLLASDSATVAIATQSNCNVS